MSEPYVPFYTSDFLGGTSGLTAATKGVYITLLCLIYEAEAPLPQRWEVLARRCGCTLPAFKKAVQDLVDDGKLSLLDDGIWSEKCEKHLAQRSERRNSAKAAAKTRWEKTQQKQGKANARAMREECQPDPEPEPYKREEPKGSLSESSDELVSRAVELYNSAAPDNGWPVVQKMTKARRSALNARLKDAGGIEGWQAAIAKASASDFLCGRAPRGSPFFASFDFLTRQSSFVKLMEGQYDNRDYHGGQGQMAVGAGPGGGGQGASIASIAARRRIARQA